jgi:hypothetical protein
VTNDGGAAGENRRMSAPWLIVLASFLFATMGVCVKLASAHYSAGEIAPAGIAQLLAVGILDRVTPLALLGMVLIVGAGLFATLLRSRSVPNDRGTAATGS